MWKRHTQRSNKQVLILLANLSNKFVISSDVMRWLESLFGIQITLIQELSFNHLELWNGGSWCSFTNSPVDGDNWQETNQRRDGRKICSPSGLDVNTRERLLTHISLTSEKNELIRVLYHALKLQNCRQNTAVVTLKLRLCFDFCFFIKKQNSFEQLVFM